MMSQVEIEKGFKYPYLPFATFLSFIEKLEKEGVPDRIDRAFLGYTSGIIQSYLIATLKAFGLIDSENRPASKLYELVNQPQQRRELVGQLLKDHYLPQMALPSNATAGQLDESFKPLQGETKRKAITFFLHAAQFAKMPLSPHFKAPRATRSRTTSRTSRKQKGGDDAVETPSAKGPKSGTDMSHTVALRSGGKLTVVLHDGANIFTLDPKDEEFVMNMVRSLRDYSGNSKPKTEASGRVQTDALSSEGGA